MKTMRLLSCLIIVACTTFSNGLPTVAKETSGSIIRHFVAFKYKSDTSPDDLKNIQHALLALKETIPEVISIEGGPNISTESLNKGFTDAFLITFANSRDRDNYLIHPEHKNFLTLALPKIEEAFVYDFDATRASTPAFTGGKVIDLTHALSSGIPDFHGDKNAFQAKQIFTVKENGYANRTFSMPEHLGTHIDAPSHFVDGGKSIDQFQGDQLFMPCAVIDVRDEVKNNPDYCLTIDKLKSFENGGQIPDKAAVLLLTGWSKRWAEPERYRNADAKGTLHFPAFSKEAAEFLVNERHASALGIDTLSLDYGLSTTYAVHHYALGKGIFLIENLDQLERLPARGAFLFCGPLPMKGGTGSPARIMAISGVGGEHLIDPR